MTRTAARRVFIALALGALSPASPVGPARAQAPADHQHAGSSLHEHASAPDDARQLVSFPPQLRMHTLVNMRDHMLALQEIQDALAAAEFDKASDIAERRLGLSSLTLHGAHEVAQFMPQTMQDVGTEMHRAASRLAVAALEASATGDVKPSLAAMARVTQQCVACHASYRLQ